MCSHYGRKALARATEKKVLQRPGVSKPCRRLKDAAVQAKSRRLRHLRTEHGWCALLETRFGPRPPRASPQEAMPPNSGTGGTCLPTCKKTSPPE